MRTPRGRERAPLQRRASGILLHVTSLPSPYGAGDLGPDAYRWVDFLAAARQRWWQVLPPGPPAAHAGNSPYRALSAFAGNPLLVSPALLVEDGWLDAADLPPPWEGPRDRADLRGAARVKDAILERAYLRFAERGGVPAFDAYCAEHAAWLAPFARFRAIARRQPGRAWWEWPAGGEVAPAHEVRREMFVQFVFDAQWQRLRAYAHTRGVRLFGDLPFYVDGDSADVWGRRDLFKLDASGRPRVVAGVPPDAFSATGQLWGNPVYAWDAHAHDGYAWWVARIRRSLAWFDMLRLDHFRGFAAHWEVPAGSASAADGEWVTGPGAEVLDAIRAALPDAALVAEDLGVITPAVRALLRTSGLPGMRVLLFGFDGATGTNPHAPHRHRARTVVYTGTHDNNTARGWFEDEADEDARARLARYLGRACTADEVSDALVRMAMMSVGRIAIVPMQDLLGLGGGARMNRPSCSTGNWEWRLDPALLTTQLAQRLAALTEDYGRS